MKIPYGHGVIFLLQIIRNCNSYLAVFYSLNANNAKTNIHLIQLSPSINNAETLTTKVPS